MKVCPQCNAHYEDSLFFCLEDGQPLNATENQIQTNAATYEKTLTLPTEEKTLNLPNQIESPKARSEEKTINLPSETSGSKSVGTVVQQQTPTTEQSSVLTSYTETNERSGKGKFVIIGGLLGGIALLGTALGGWWMLQKPSQGNEVANANANVNKQARNSDNSLSVSNTNLSGVFGAENSNLSNITTSNSNKSTPKPSPSATKDKKESPTPTPNQTPEPTPTAQPTPKTPTPTPTPLPTRPPKVVSGGVLNGRAINLVKPSYPPAARAVKAAGAVNVLVTVDENGNVISANAVSGHPLLKGAAEAAARASKFTPPVINGQPVKVTGVIVYRFNPE